MHGRPIHFVLGKHPGLLDRGGMPFAPGRQRHHRVHIGARAGADIDRIGMKARDHRRIHGVGGAKAAEQERPAAAKAGAAIGPDRLDASYIGCDLGIVSARLITGRHMFIAQMPAQRLETAVHFIGDGARMRPRRGICRPQTSRGEFLRQIFQDRQRFPHHDIAVDQHRHLAAAGDRADLGFEVGSIERDSQSLQRQCPRLSSRSMAASTMTNSSCCR